MWVVFIALGYILGSIPSGVLLARSFGLQDPREFGSGNIGASNMTRLGGKKLGALTLLTDLAKGLLPVLAARFYFENDPVIVSLVGFASVFGHCYSIFLRLKGGKGVATAAGVFAVIDPLSLAAGLIVWVIVFVVERITSLSALTACLAIPVAMAIKGSPTPHLVLAVVIALLIFRRHEENIKALLQNKERSFRKSR